MLEQLRARYRDITGLDDLRPAFARKLIARHGAEYVEEKLALLETWLRAKRAAGETVVPLKAFLDALTNNWPVPMKLTPRLDPVAATNALLQRIEEERREAAPPEVALGYLRQIREILSPATGGRCTDRAPLAPWVSPRGVDSDCVRGPGGVDLAALRPTFVVENR